MICYPTHYFMGLQWVCEAIRIQEWERTRRGFLDEYRRMMLYHLQWGTPTGPYWVTVPRKRVMYTCTGPYNFV